MRIESNLSNSRQSQRRHRIDAINACNRKGSWCPDPFDPEQNIWGAAKLLRQLADRFKGDTVKVLAAYHAGGGAVNRAGGIPYPQTREYVEKVLCAYDTYQKKSDGYLT